MAPSHLAPNFGATFSPLSSAHAFNLAAFRSPGFLGAHGFAAFGANIGYRDHSPNSFDGNTNGGANNNGGTTANPLNAFNTNSNSPTNQYSSARSSISPTTRDGYMNSDYYHNNNTTSKLTDSHNNSEYLTSDRHHSHSHHTPSHHNNNNNNIHSHHSFERAASESPELSVNEQRCSPVESLRSYPTSQKSDEGGNGATGGNNGSSGGGAGTGYHSPSHPDSVGSRSPENLTASTKKSVGEMLDHHKIPLSFLGQPLAALHSMTEMKSSSNNGGGAGGNGHSANANITGNGIGLQQTQSQIGSHGAANPHGIDTILSRPPPVTSAGLNALTSGE